MISSGSSGEYVATGDYDPPTQNHSSILATDAPGQTIDGIPNGVESLSLMATPKDSSQWQGVSLVPTMGNVDMLLLPAASSCALSTNVGFPIAGMTFGAVSGQTLIATSAPVKKGEGTIFPSFSVDLTQGRIAQMTQGLTVPRIRAAFASLGDGRAIVSGGVRISGVFEQTAQVFDEANGDFDPSPFQLEVDRADHAAVTLASGAMLLVGGQNLDGLITASALISFDASQSTWAVNESNTTALTARIHPTAIRLANQNILVGGGFSDAAGTVPVGLVEFLSPDASSVVATQPVPPQPIQSFVALEGGGALMVTVGISPNVYFVNESGATPIDSIGSATDAKLFSRAAGGAILWTGSSWLSFDPWKTANAYFLPIANTSGPAMDSPIATSDPGMRAWVNDDGTVSLWRDSVRNEFASDDTFLTADTLTNLLAPDTIPAPSSDPTLGLSLVSGETVFVSDSRYLDVQVDVSSTGASLPLVVLRAPSGDIAVGGNSCPFLPSTTASAVHVMRIGPLVQFAAGGAISTCTTIDPSERVSVGIRGGSSESRVLDLHVARLAR